MDISRRQFVILPSGIVMASGLNACVGAGFLSENTDTKASSTGAKSARIVTSSAHINGAVSETNRYRKAKGLGAVVHSRSLQKIAEKHALAMAKAGKVSHKIGFGDSFARRMDSSGYRAREAAENVAGGYHNITDAMKGWEDSPGHRKNLLKPIITEIGMGVAQAYDKQFDFYWAMVLARPFVFATQ